MKKIYSGGSPLCYAASLCELLPYSLTDALLEASGNTEPINDDPNLYPWG